MEELKDDITKACRTENLKLRAEIETKLEAANAKNTELESEISKLKGKAKTYSESVSGGWNVTRVPRKPISESSPLVTNRTSILTELRGMGESLDNLDNVTYRRKTTESPRF